MPKPNCFKLAMQLIWPAFCFALLRVGSSIAAKIAIMAITTRSSIRVKPERATAMGDAAVKDAFAPVAKCAHPFVTLALTRPTAVDGLLSCTDSPLSSEPLLITIMPAVLSVSTYSGPDPVPDQPGIAEYLAPHFTSALQPQTRTALGWVDRLADRDFR